MSNRPPQVVTIGQQPEALTHLPRPGIAMYNGEIPGGSSGKIKGTLCNRNAICQAVTSGEKPVRERPSCKRCYYAAQIDTPAYNGAA